LRIVFELSKTRQRRKISPRFLHHRRHLPVTESVALPPDPKAKRFRGHHVQSARQRHRWHGSPPAGRALISEHSNVAHAITFFSAWSRLSIRLNRLKQRVGSGVNCARQRKGASAWWPLSSRPLNVPSGRSVFGSACLEGGGVASPSSSLRGSSIFPSRGDSPSSRPSCLRLEWLLALQLL
jgi:hypothetical protein